MEKVFKGLMPVKMCGLSPLASFYFVTFSYCVTVVVPSLVCINIDSFSVIYSVIISSRVIRRQKSFSPVFSKIKSGQVEGTF